MIIKYFKRIFETVNFEEKIGFPFHLEASKKIDWPLLKFIKLSKKLTAESKGCTMDGNYLNFFDSPDITLIHIVTFFMST